MSHFKSLILFSFWMLSQPALGVEIVDEASDQSKANGYLILIQNGQVSVQTNTEAARKTLDQFSIDEAPAEKLKQAVIILCQKVRFTGDHSDGVATHTALECHGKVRFQAYGVIGQADSLLCEQQGDRFRFQAKGNNEVVLFRHTDKDGIDPTVRLKASSLEFDSSAARLSIRGTGNLEAFIDGELQGK